MSDRPSHARVPPGGAPPSYLDHNASTPVHPEVLAEAAQISLRLKGESRGYERVKEAAERGTLNRLTRNLSATGYLGEAPRLARECPRVVARLLGSSS